MQEAFLIYRLRLFVIFCFSLRKIFLDNIFDYFFCSSIMPSDYFSFSCPHLLLRQACNSQIGCFSAVLYHFLCNYVYLFCPFSPSENFPIYPLCHKSLFSQHLFYSLLLPMQTLISLHFQFTSIFLFLWLLALVLGTAYLFAQIEAAKQIPKIISSKVIVVNNFQESSEYTVPFPLFYSTFSYSTHVDIVVSHQSFFN